MNLLAKITSWVFLPLFAPVYALLILFYLPESPILAADNSTLYGLNPPAKWLLINLFFALSFLAPAITLFVLFLQKRITTLMLADRKERIFPSIMVNVYAILLLLLLLRLLPKEMSGYAFIIGLSFGSFLAVLIATIITTRWKISLHAVGMGILTGTVFTYFLHLGQYPVWLVPALIFISGFVLSMRMVLKAHDLSQLFAGYALGFLATNLSIQALIYFL